MARKKKTSIVPNLGTACFLGLIVVAIIASFGSLAISTDVIWLVLGILGALVAIYNITKEEEMHFLMATAGLIVVFLGMVQLGSIDGMLKSFFEYMTMGLGVAGFIVGFSLIIKMSLDK